MKHAFVILLVVTGCARPEPAGPQTVAACAAAYLPDYGDGYVDCVDRLAITAQEHADALAQVDAILFALPSRCTRSGCY
jgi:hypothetical protein